MTSQAHTLDDDDIDHLAVIQVAHDGMRMHLKGRERQEAVRRMHLRVDADIIAWRLYTTPRTVQRVAAQLGLTEQQPHRRHAAQLVDR
jgi:hypothetical protein